MKVSPSTLRKSSLSPHSRSASGGRLARRAARLTPGLLTRGMAAIMSLFALFGFNPRALAATSTWTGSSGASDFNTAADWGGTAVGSGNILAFTSANASSTTTLNNDLTAGFSIGGITFASGSPSYTITGNSVALVAAGSITNSSANVQTINIPITMAGAENFTATSGNLTFGGNISGAGALAAATTASTGVVTLSNYNVTGNLTVGAANVTGEPAGALTISGGTYGSSSSALSIAADGDAAALDISGGTGTFGTLSIGVAGGQTATGMEITGGNATFTTVNIGSSANTAQDLLINDASGTVALGNVNVIREEGGATAGLVIDAGTVTASALLLSEQAHSADLNMSGGSLTIGNSSSTGDFKIGTAGNTNNLTMTGGSLTYLGTDGLLASTAAGVTGKVSITGATSVATLTGITLNSANSATATSTLTVGTGATLYLGSVGLVLNQPSGSTVSATFGTATIGAIAPWSTSAPIGLTAGDTTTFQASNSSLTTPQNITLNGVISAGGGLNITGPGTVYMAQSSPNTYTGATSVSSGTLELETADAQVTTGAGAITVASGGTLAVEIGTAANQFTNGTSGNGTLGGLISTVATGFAAGSSIGVDTTLGSTSYSGNIGATDTAVGLTKIGANTLTLAGLNTYTGNTNVNAGTLALGAAGQVLNNTAVNVAAGAALQLVPSTGAVSIGTTAASLTLNGGSSLLLGSTSSGSAETSTFNTLTLNGGLTVGGSSAASLTFNINNTSNDELVVTGNVTFGSGGGLITIVAPSGSTAPSSATQTYTLVSAGGGLTSGGFTLASNSQVISLGGNSYDASLSETGGATETLTLNEVSLTYYWTGATSASWSAPANFSTDHTGVLPQSAALGSTNNVVLTADSPSGTNTATQTLDNSYSVNSLAFSSTAPAINLTTGSGGNGASNTLTLEAANAFGVTVGASSPVTSNYGAGIGLEMQNGSAAQTLNVPIALGNSQTWEIDSTASALTVAGVISDGGSGYSLTKTGAGTLILSATSTYSGGTFVRAGTLMLSPGGSLPVAGTLTVAGTGKFDLGSSSQTIAGLSDGGVSTGVITASTGAAGLIFNNTTPASFGGTITDGNSTNSAASLALLLQGSSSVTLSGSNSFTGGTTLTGGSLTVANNYALGSSTSSNSNAGLTLNPTSGTVTASFTSANPAIATLNSGSGAGTEKLVLGNPGGTPTTLTIGGGGVGITEAGSTFSGVISDLSATDPGAVGNLNIVGGTYLILTAANTFTGTTTISGSGPAGPSEIVLQNSLALQDSTLNLPNLGGVLNFGALTSVTLGGLSGSQNLALTNSSSGAVALTVGGANGNTTFSGSLTGSGALTVAGLGTTTLDNDNTTGNITVGTIAVTGGAAGELTIDGGTFGGTGATLTVQSDGDGQGFIMNGGTATFGTLDVGTVGGETGAGMLITGGTAAFTTTILGGNPASLNAANSPGAITVTGGSVSFGNTYIGRSGGLVVNGAGAVVTASLLNVSSNAAVNHQASLFMDSGSLTIGNSASTADFEIGTSATGGNNVLTMTGGTLTYAGTDGLQLGGFSYATISGGTANLSGITVDSATGGNGTSELVVSGGNLYLGGAAGGVGLVVNSPSATDFAQFGTATIGATTAWSTVAPITLTTADTTTFQAANASLTGHNITLDGVLSGAGNVNVTGPGTVYMGPTSPNTYTGATTVTSGALEYLTTEGQVTTNPGAITVDSGATLAVQVGTGANNFTNGTSGPGTIGGLLATVNTGFQTGSLLGIDTTLGSTSYAGNITNAGMGLAVFGGNTLTLTGANTYTGPTNVITGALALNSSAPLGNTAINVATGATLQVTPANGPTAIGAAGGASLTLAGGSTLLVGSAAETSTFNTLTLNGNMTIGGLNAPAGLTFALNNSSSDELIVTGAVSFGTDGGLITLVIPSGSTAPSSASATYTLVTAGSGLISGGLTLASNSQVVTIGGNSYDASLSETGGTTETLTLNEVTLTYYWNGGASASWSVPGNFATDHTGVALQTNALGSTNNVVLTTDSPSGTNTATQTLDNSYTINSLSYSSAAPAINLTTGSGGNGAANTLTLTAASGFGITAGASSPVTTAYAAGIGLEMQNGSAAQTLSVPVALGGSQTWEIDSTNHALTVAGVISDGGSGYALTKTGPGTLIFSGSNTYSGGTIVSAGTLMLSPTGSLPSTGTLTVNGSGTFDLGNNNVTLATLSDGGVSTGAITASTGAATITFTNTAPLSFKGAITDANGTNSNASLALVLQGSSSVTLSGSNSFTGGATLYSGNLIASNNYALGNPTSANSNAGLTLNPASGAVTAFFTSANPTIASLNSGPGAGTGNVVLGNSSGTPTTLNIGGGGLSITNTGSSFTGVISDLSATVPGAVGNLNVFGGALLALSGADTFTGITTISGSGPEGPSEIQLANALALQDSTLNYNNQGGVLNFGSLTAATLAGLTGAENLALTNSTASGVTLSIGGTNLSTLYTGNLGGLGSLIKNGTGTIQLGSGIAGGAGYAGATTVNAGTLIIGGTSSLTGALNVSAATLTIQDDATAVSPSALILNDVAGFPTPATLTLSGTASVTAPSFSFGNNTRSGGTVNIQNAASMTINGAYDLLNNDGGTSTAEVTTTNLTGGTLAVQNIIYANPGGAATASLATINLNGGALKALASDPSGSQFIPAFAKFDLNVDAGGAIINTNGFNDTIAQPLVDGGGNPDGGLTVEDTFGTGSLTLIGLNTYNGPTTIATGATLKLGNGTAGDDGTIDSSSGITDSGSLIFDRAGNLTEGVAISGTGSVVKIGAGVEVLSALNNYSGKSSVIAGMLEVSGSLSATASVSVTTGTLQLADNNALNSAAPITLTAGVLQVLASQSEALGALTLAGGGASSLTIGASGDIIHFADSSALTWSGALTIADWDGASAGGGSDQIFFGATNDLTPSQLADITFTNGAVDGVSYVSDSAVQLADGELVAAAIPEPGTWAMILAGAGILLVTRRSRRRNSHPAQTTGARSA